MPSPETSAENGKLGGRPVASATLIKQEFRKALAEEIKKEAGEWIGAIKSAALGHYVEVKNADGTVKVYKKSPDPSAWEKGMNRAFGAPEQSVDMTSDGEKIDQMNPALLALVKEFEDKAKKALLD